MEIFTFDTPKIMPSSNTKNFNELSSIENNDEKKNSTDTKSINLITSTQFLGLPSKIEELGLIDPLIAEELGTDSITNISSTLGFPNNLNEEDTITQDMNFLIMETSSITPIIKDEKNFTTTLNENFTINNMNVSKSPIVLDDFTKTTKSSEIKEIETESTIILNSDFFETTTLLQSNNEDGKKENFFENTKHIG